MSSGSLAPARLRRRCRVRQVKVARDEGGKQCGADARYGRALDELELGIVFILV
jgi:hypothetical protein